MLIRNSEAAFSCDVESAPIVVKLCVEKCNACNLSRTKVLSHVFPCLFRCESVVCGSSIRLDWTMDRYAVVVGSVVNIHHIDTV
jgi:hypothetical protein